MMHGNLRIAWTNNTNEWEDHANNFRVEGDRKGKSQQIAKASDERRFKALLTRNCSTT
jgi:hypothetical protein